MSVACLSEISQQPTTLFHVGGEERKEGGKEEDRGMMVCKIILARGDTGGGHIVRTGSYLG